MWTPLGSKKKSRNKLVAVASVVVIVRPVILKSDTVCIMRPRACKKRMDIAQEVAGTAQTHSDLHMCYTDIRKRIVVPFHQYSDRISLSVSYNVDTGYICVRRA